MRKLLEQLVTFSLLLFGMGSFTVLFLGSDMREGALLNQSHIGFSAFEVLIYFGCACFALLDYRRMLVSFWSAWPFLLISLMAVLSTSWSIDPGTTFRRSGVLFGTTIFGIYLGGRYSTEEFQKLLLQSLLLLIGASLVLLIIAPSLALDPSDSGAFRGLTVQKNLFGEYMGILLLLGLTYRFKIRRRFARVLVILLASTLLLCSHSGTSLLATIAAVSFFPVLFFVRFPKYQAIPLTLIGTVVLGGIFSLLVSGSGLVLNTLGKDQTLTGRTVIWEFVWQDIIRRPLLGYGFDSYWQDMRGPSLPLDELMGGWSVPHAHNGYLEALLGIGTIGMCLIMIALFRMGYDALAYVRLQNESAGLWPFAFLFYCLVRAFAEPSLVTRDGLSYLLLVVISTSLSLQRSRRRAMRLTNWSRIYSVRRARATAPTLLGDSSESTR